MYAGDLAHEIETEHYFVRHYVNDPKRVIVSFASLGFATLGGPIEEYRRSLDEAGASYIFVTDRGANWYNNPQTDTVFNQIAQICSGYDHVGALGESAGGCGAILFTNFYTQIDRVLAFCPQFSIASPFREFDNTRDYATKQAIEIYRTIDFSTCTNKDNIQLIYGNIDWRDIIHSSMYSALGFRTLYIEGAGHEVSASLKRYPSGDLLTPLIVEFSDFAADFSEAAIARMLQHALASRRLRSPNLEMAAASLPRYAPLRPAEEITDLVLVSRDKPAMQSSTCAFSRCTDPGEDASGANDGRDDRAFGFHTDIEDSPWWEVDLLDACDIRRICILNRSDSVELAIRSSEFEILVKQDDAEDWRSIVKREGQTPIGFDDEPFIWQPRRAVRARFVRIRLIHRNYMHLRQVKIYV